VEGFHIRDDGLVTENLHEGQSIDPSQLRFCPG
jgi:hypothetical protein